jgi:hypothetical protein
MIITALERPLRTLDGHGPLAKLKGVDRRAHLVPAHLLTPAPSMLSLDGPACRRVRDTGSSPSDVGQYARVVPVYPGQLGL